MTDRRNIDLWEWELRCDLAAAYRLFARCSSSTAAFAARLSAFQAAGRN
jgi:hypothetical protein